MLSSIVVNFIFDSVSLGDKGFFSFANVLQIADVAVELSIGVRAIFGQGGALNHLPKKFLQVA